MLQSKYKIYELSARAVMSYATEEADRFSFSLNASATERCKVPTAQHEQDGNALFFQTMCVLWGDDYRESTQPIAITELSDVIFYMDFSGIFDRDSGKRMNQLRQEKARDIFRPEGICLDFGSGPHRYLAFERSGNMSRQARLSFIRADVHDAVRCRLLLDMTIGDCQLSKLYAYMGLMLSGGVRIEDIGLDKPHRVVVIDNPLRTIRNVQVITVTDDGAEGSPLHYRRTEERKDIEVTCFDGEGLISKQYAKTIDCAYCGEHIHTSFQVRLPFVKGMLHQVDFKDFLTSAGTDTITDLWGVEHPVAEVDIILTKSMFKGYGWLKDSGMTWADYWGAFRRYRHALYITNVSKTQPEQHTELNYQFLTTVSVCPEEFRPADLPHGWASSPAEDSRNWLTKETEVAYYNFCVDEDFRRSYFLDVRKHKGVSKNSRAYRMAQVLAKNPLFLSEPVYARALEDMAESILKKYAVGRLVVAGDNRYLSGDLLDFLVLLLRSDGAKTKRQQSFYAAAMTNRFPESAFYAPGATYPPSESCTLLRNPHIARNEELQLTAYHQKDNMRSYYLGHLTDVVMVDAFMLAAERLGGADYDGDMIKTISDPILNACVRRNYGEYGTLEKDFNLPLLMIPAAQPQIRNATDWQARFDTVRSTFSSRVGQICNAALDRSIIAYNETLPEGERRSHREETETLAILTGLEIDSAKSGVKPDLSQYLGKRTGKRSAFLQYKALLEAAEERRAWYELTYAQKRKAFFDKVDWERIDSNVERLPYLAEQLKKHTKKIKQKLAPDSALFAFAQREDWKDQLNSTILLAVTALIKDYEACLSRIRACGAPVQNKARKQDIERILYAHGQEEQIDADTLYALFGTLPPQRVTDLRQAIAERRWHFLSPEEREHFLLEQLPEPEFASQYDLLADFRHSGFRVLGDLVCDMEEENIRKERGHLLRESDSSAFVAMMRAYLAKPIAQPYREAVSGQCRALLDTIVKPAHAVAYLVALGKRDLLWELVPEQIERQVLRHDK